MRRFALLLVMLAGILTGPAAFAQERPAFPALTGRVVDAANLLSPEDEAALTALSEGLEGKTTSQLVVATVPSLGGREIEEYAVDLFRAWGLGQREADNGALLLVAPNERKVRIEVGYGLEGTLTDAVSKLIIEGSIIPRFKAGDFPGGIRRGAEDVVGVLSGDVGEWTKRAKERVPEEDIFGTIFTLLFIAIFVMVLFSGRGRRRLGPGGPIFIPSGGGWSGGGGGGGGGFSGGGGSSGGGGASGSW